jgi:hypothetical protein
MKVPLHNSVKQTEVLKMLMEISENPNLLDEIPPSILGRFLKSVGMYIKRNRY